MPVVAHEAKQYTRISVAPLTGALGAEVSGIQLRDLDDEVQAELHDAWLEHKVLFFRDQELTRDDHVAYGRRWGSLEQHPFTPNEAEHPEIVVLESTPERFYAAEQWHSDVTGGRARRSARSCGRSSCRRSAATPCWSNMELAYEQLPDPIKEQIEGKQAVHSFVKVFGRRLSEEEREQKRQEFPDQLHPVVRTHPETGRRSLYVNAPFTMHIVDMEPDESERCSTSCIGRRQCPSSSAVSGGRRAASPSGTTAARSTTPCPTSPASTAAWSASPSKATAPASPTLNFLAPRGPRDPGTPRESAGTGYSGSFSWPGGRRSSPRYASIGLALPSTTAWIASAMGIWMS